MNRDDLNSVFAALSDPTRRGMLAQLAKGEANVRALTETRAISQPAISKHLRVLERAGLITRTKSGRESIIRMDPTPLDGVTTWIDHYTRHWQSQFDAVDTYLKAKKKRAVKTKETT